MGRSFGPTPPEARPFGWGPFTPIHEVFLEDFGRLYIGLMVCETWHILGDRLIPLASSFELIVGFDECGPRNPGDLSFAMI